MLAPHLVYQDPGQQPVRNHHYAATSPELRYMRGGKEATTKTLKHGGLGRGWFKD